MKNVRYGKGIARIVRVLPKKIMWKWNGLNFYHLLLFYSNGKDCNGIAKCEFATKIFMLS